MYQVKYYRKSKSYLIDSFSALLCSACLTNDHVWWEVAPLELPSQRLQLGVFYRGLMSVDKVSVLTANYSNKLSSYHRLTHKISIYCVPVVRLRVLIPSGDFSCRLCMMCLPLPGLLSTVQPHAHSVNWQPTFMTIYLLVINVQI